MNTYPGVRIYCEHCVCNFQKRTDVSNHIKYTLKHAGKSNIITCEECKVALTHRKSLKNHNILTLHTLNSRYDRIVMHSSEACKLKLKNMISQIFLSWFVFVKPPYPSSQCCVMLWCFAWPPLPSFWLSVMFWLTPPLPLKESWSLWTAPYPSFSLFLTVPSHCSHWCSAHKLWIPVGIC